MARSSNKNITKGRNLGKSDTVIDIQHLVISKIYLEQCVDIIVQKLGDRKFTDYGDYEDAVAGIVEKECPSLHTDILSEPMLAMSKWRIIRNAVRGKKEFLVLNT